MRTAILIVLLSAAAPARAQYVSLDRQGDQTHIGLRFDFGFPDDAVDAEAFFRTEVYGQIAVAGWGGYASVPFQSEIDPKTDRDASAGIGNVEVGAFRVFGAGPVDLVTRLGLTIPTARDRPLLGLAGFARLTDIIDTVPDTFGIRLSLSPDISFGIVFLRADVGVDLAIETEDHPGRDALEASLRANVGAGVSLGLFSATVELVNNFALSDESFSIGGDVASALAVSAAVNVLFLHPFIAFTFPLDEDSRAVYGFAFTFGAEARL